MKKIIPLLLLILLSCIVSAEKGMNYEKSIDGRTTNIIQYSQNKYLPDENGNLKTFEELIEFSSKEKGKITISWAGKKVQLKKFKKTSSGNKNYDSSLDNTIITKGKTEHRWLEILHNNTDEVGYDITETNTNCNYQETYLNCDGLIIDFSEAHTKQGLNIEMNKNSKSFTFKNLSGKIKELDPTIHYENNNTFITSSAYVDNTDASATHDLALSDTHHVGFQSGPNYIRRTYLRFNLTSLLSDKSSINIIYFGFGRTQISGPDSVLHPFEFLKNLTWDSSTLTWNNQPCDTTPNSSCGTGTQISKVLRTWGQPNVDYINDFTTEINDNLEFDLYLTENKSSPTNEYQFNQPYTNITYSYSIITTLLPTNNSNLPTDTISTNVNVTTDVNSVCAWNNTLEDFSSMTNLTITGGKLHIFNFTNLTGLENGQTYELFINCQENSTGFYDNSSTKFNVDFTELNITIKDEETQQIIGLENFTIELSNEDKNFFLKTSTTNGNFVINPVRSGTLRITITSKNYEARTTYETILTNQTTNFVTMFTVNSSSGTLKDVILTVVDEAGAGLSDANIKVFVQNPNTGVFEKNIEKFTNINGKVLATLIKDIRWYKFTVYNKGTLCYQTQNAFTISTADDEIIFSCTPTDNYITRRDIYNNVNLTLSVTNTSNATGFFTLEGASIINTNFCLDVYQYLNGVRTNINSSCTNSTSALITINVNATSILDDVTYLGVTKYLPSGQTVYQTGDAYQLHFEYNVKPDLSGMGLLLTVILSVFVSYTLFKKNQPRPAVISVGFIYFLSTLFGFSKLPALSTGSNLGSGIIVLIMSLMVAYGISKKGGE